MTALDITRARPGFDPEIDWNWTDSEWHRATVAAGLRRELIESSSGPIPGELVRVAPGVTYRLAELDGQLIALPTAQDETYFMLALDGVVDCIAFFEHGDGEAIDPADVVATAEVQLEYSSFDTHNKGNELRFFWVPERIWAVNGRTTGDPAHRTSLLGGAQ